MKYLSVSNLISDLIADRVAIGDAVSASVRAGLNSQEVDSDLATVSLFCSQPDSWEFFVSAAGYLDYLSNEDALSVPEIIETIVQDQDQANGYFCEVGTLPFEKVL